MVKASEVEVRWRRLGANSIIAHESIHEDPSAALDRAGMTVFRDIAFLAAGPASERSRSGTRDTRLRHGNRHPRLRRGGLRHSGRAVWRDGGNSVLQSGRVLPVARLRLVR